jgi:hypothetical protein
MRRIVPSPWHGGSAAWRSISQNIRQFHACSVSQLGNNGFLPQQHAGVASSIDDAVTITELANTAFVEGDSFFKNPDYFNRLSTDPGGACEEAYETIVKPSRLALEEVNFYWEMKLLPLLSSCQSASHDSPNLLLADIELDKLRELVESPTKCPFLEGEHMLVHFEQAETAGAAALGCVKVELPTVSDEDIRELLVWEQGGSRNNNSSESPEYLALAKLLQLEETGGGSAGVGSADSNMRDSRVGETRGCCLGVQLEYQPAFGMMSVPTRNSNRGVGTKLAATLETFIVEAARWNFFALHLHALEHLWQLDPEGGLVRDFLKQCSAVRSKGGAGLAVPNLRAPVELRTLVDDEPTTGAGGEADGRGAELTVRIKMPLINVRGDLFEWYGKKGYQAVGGLVELPPVLQPMCSADYAGKVKFQFYQKRFAVV